MNCTTIKYVKVIVSPAPFDVTITGNTTVCPNDSTLLTAIITNKDGSPVDLTKFDFKWQYGNNMLVKNTQTYYAKNFGGFQLGYTVTVTAKDKKLYPCLNSVTKRVDLIKKSITATLTSISIDTTKLHCPGTPFTVKICSNEPLDTSKLIIKKTGSCSLYEFKTNDKIRSFITLESKRGTYCYLVTYSVIGGTPYNLKADCNKYTITHPCMNPIDFYIRSGNDLTVQVTGDTVVCCSDSTTLNADLTSDFDVTKAKVSWTNCNNTPISMIAGSKSIKVPAGCYKLNVVSPCGNNYTKTINVTSTKTTLSLSNFSLDTNNVCPGSWMTYRVCWNACKPGSVNATLITENIVNTSCNSNGQINNAFYRENKRFPGHCINRRIFIDPKYAGCTIKYAVTGPCMDTAYFTLKVGKGNLVTIIGDTLVSCGASTTLSPKVIDRTTNLTVDTTKYKITWLDNLNQTLTKGANNSVSVKAGSYKLIYVGPCNDTIIKEVNVVTKAANKYNIVATYDCQTQKTKLEVTNSKLFAWTDDKSMTNPRYVDPYAIIKQYTATDNYHPGFNSGLCDASIDVTIPCTKPTTGIKTVQIATGWYSKSPTGTCDASTFKSYVNEADLIDKYNTHKYVNGDKVYNYCYNAEKVDFVFDTINKSFIGSQLYVSGTCKPFKDGYYGISANGYDQVIKRMRCAFAFHVSCGKVDSLFAGCIDDYRGLGSVLSGPNKFDQSTSKPKIVSEIKIHPNPNNGQFSVILDNAQVDSYKIEVYDLNGKLIHTQNMYDDKSGTIQTKLDLTPYSLSKGLYMIHAVTNDNTFIERVEIE